METDFNKFMFYCMYYLNQLNCLFYTKKNYLLKN